MTLKAIFILLVVVVWLVPQVYFLYCLEKRRPWAKELARSLMVIERF